MPRIALVSGSPFPSSRTDLLGDWIASRLTAEGFRVARVNVRELPAEDLLLCRANAAPLKEAGELIAQAVGVVILSPVFKASYPGGLKAFLDVLPQHGFADKIVLPVAVGGSLAHALAIDYGLRPVLLSMGAPHVVNGVFALDALLERTEQGLRLEKDLEQRLVETLHRFGVNLRRHHHHLTSETPSLPERIPSSTT